MRVVFATGNEGKMVEIREIMHDFLIKHDIELVSLKDADIHADIVEDGSTFEENAVIKAKEIAKLTSDIVLADDSGLEVDFLDKAPGIYSSRFLGEDTSYTVKNNYILDLSRFALDTPYFLFNSDMASADEILPERIPATLFRHSLSNFIFSIRKLDSILLTFLSTVILVSALLPI